MSETDTLDSTKWLRGITTALQVLMFPVNSLKVDQLEGTQSELVYQKLVFYLLAHSPLDFLCIFFARYFHSHQVFEIQEQVIQWYTNVYIYVA